jgi:uncharacterized protein YkwD
MHLIIWFSLIFLPIEQNGYYDQSHQDFLESTHAQQFIDPRNFDDALLEACVFHATNALRSERGLEETDHSAALQTAARGHAIEMAQYDYFSHKDRSGEYSEDRIPAAGGLFPYTGENIAKFYPYDMNYGQSYYPRSIEQGYEYRYTGSKERIPPIRYTDFAKMLVEEWFHSKGHRENLMDPEFNYLGVGVAITTNAEFLEEMPSVYLVQNFGGR